MKTSFIQQEISYKGPNLQYCPNHYLWKNLRKWRNMRAHYFWNAPMNIIYFIL